jgi:hypothetical protein
VLDHKDWELAAGKYKEEDAVPEPSLDPELGITDDDLPDWWKKMQQEA